MKFTTKEELLRAPAATHFVKSWSGIIDPKLPLEVSLTAVINGSTRDKPHEPQFGIFKWFRSPRLILDVGANCGQSIVSLKCVNESAKIYSFEPNPLSFEIASRVAERFTDCVVFNFGLGTVDARLPIFTPVIDGLLISPLTSLDPGIFDPGGRMHLFTTQEVAKGAEVSIFRQEIEIKNGDALNLEPDILKIDAEGAELSVLTGLRRTIARNRPFVMVEKSEFAEVAQFLYSLGFISYAWDGLTNDRGFPTLRQLSLNSATDDRLVPLNLFYAHRDLVSFYSNQYGIGFS